MSQAELLSEETEPPIFNEEQEMYNRVSTSRETLDNTHIFIAEESKDMTEKLTKTLTGLVKEHASCEKTDNERGRKEAREKIEKLIRKFFENNACEEEIYIIAPQVHA
jgi:hypothetical protein